MTNSVTVLEETTVPSASTVRHFTKSPVRLEGRGPEGCWLVAVELLNRIDDESLDFKFRAYVRECDKAVPFVLEPNELLKPCAIALPDGHYVTNGGKTIIVFYAASKHEEDVAGASLHLRNVIETMCAQADNKYYVGKHTRLIMLR